MRLTIGGTLFVLGVGLVGGYMLADKDTLAKAKTALGGLTDQAGSLVGYFKSGQSEKKPDVYSPPPPFPNGVPGENTGAGSVSTSSASVGAGLTSNQPGSTTTAATPPAQLIEPVVVPVAEPKPLTKAVPPKKSKGKSKRSRAKKSKGSKTQSAAAAKPKPTPNMKLAKSAPKPVAAVPDKTQKLIGTYVSLELITGRSVQGVLESKSATHYSLNVPGLGPLQYPIENVKSVQPAQ